MSNTFIIEWSSRSANNRTALAKISAISLRMYLWISAYLSILSPFGILYCFVLLHSCQSAEYSISYSFTGYLDVLSQCLNIKFVMILIF